MIQVKKWNAESGFLILPYQSHGITASFPVENKMAAIRRLALFNALLDLVDDEYQLSSKHSDNSVLLLISAFSEKKERQQAIRITGYAEHVVPSYTDSVFRSHFRLSRTSAELLTGLLGTRTLLPLVCFNYC